MLVSSRFVRRIFPNGVGAVVVGVVVFGAGALLFGGSGAGVARGATVDVTGGRTSVLLDTATLESAAGLTISGVSGEVQAPGDLGAGSVAFPITPRDAAVRPTTFSYDPADFLGTFSGTIEHAGTVRFNSDAVEVGNFSIAFDAARAGTLGGTASGFYVRSNTDAINAILFDVGAPSALDAAETSLAIDADLLVSPEFGQFLIGGGLASSDLAGADVGDARIAATALGHGGGGGGGTVIPLPPAVVPGLIALGFLAPRLWRRSA